MAAAATADAAAGGGGAGGTEEGSSGNASLGRLVGRVHTAAALERSEGLRRQAVSALEGRVGEVLKRWDECVAGDLFKRSGGGGGGDGGGDAAQAEGGDEASSSGGGGGGGSGWRPSLEANPLLAVTAPELVNVPAVVVSLCHSSSPVLQRRVLDLARRWGATERMGRRGVVGEKEGERNTKILKEPSETRRERS